MTARLVHNMPAEEYHRHESDSTLSASTCKRMATLPPAQAKWERDNPKPSSPQMMLGTVTHSAILEPETFDQTYIVAPAMDRRTKEGKAAYTELLADGRQVVTLDDYDTAMRMRDAVRAHPEAAELLADGHGEVSLFATDPETGIALKSREDWMPNGRNVVVDLKTSRNPGEGFARDAYTLGYDIGAHHYRTVRREYNIGQGVDVWDAWPDYQWLVVGVEPPHLVALYRPSDLMAELGAQRWRRGRDAWIECTTSGIWPGLPTGVSEIDPPRWAL